MKLSRHDLIIILKSRNKRRTVDRCSTDSSIDEDRYSTVSRQMKRNGPHIPPII